MLYYTSRYILYHIIPYYTILFYAILYRIVPYNTVLYPTTLFNYTLLYYTILYPIILYCIMLFHIVLCHIIRNIILYYTQVGPCDRPAPSGGRPASRCREAWGAGTHLSGRSGGRSPPCGLNYSANRIKHIWSLHGKQKQQNK